MLSLKSPKVNVGLHCLKLRTKTCTSTRLWIPMRHRSTTATTALRTGASRLRRASDPTGNRFERICAVANAGAAKCFRHSVREVAE